jgi:hypothetical protein
MLGMVNPRNNYWIIMSKGMKFGEGRELLGWAIEMINYVDGKVFDNKW